MTVVILKDKSLLKFFIDKKAILYRNYNTKSQDNFFHKSEGKTKKQNTFYIKLPQYSISPE
ncbi:hypothetical protein CHRYSEO8AT_250034 [Chryseobacterium sp. 8AT]|nr:hypothetical protein CHRYSEO8AT_250034 [Chryseobacterium sp. 8AT]